MKRESEMKTRKERNVKTRNKGAATRQDDRAGRHPGRNRKPLRILPDLKEPEQWSPRGAVIAGVVGALPIYALMWLAAAF